MRPLLLERLPFEEPPMPRRSLRPLPDRTLELSTHLRDCPACGLRLWAANKPRRTVTTLDGLVRLLLQVRSCRNPDCPRRGACLRPEQEGRFALPQHDFGLEVLWVLRDCLSGEVLLAKSLLSSTQGDLAGLLREVKQALTVPIVGVVSDGQDSIRKAVKTALDGVPHQLCHFHYLREAAQPVSEADRHAKVQLKKEVRGIRPIERKVEGRQDAEAEVIRGYCAAVRTALTDDGRPPLEASGLKLRDRLAKVADSLDRVGAKRGSRRN